MGVAWPREPQAPSARAPTEPVALCLCHPAEWDSTNNKSINLCPMLWYGAKMQESTAKNTSQMTSDLKELEMLYDREVVTRPG